MWVRSLLSQADAKTRSTGAPHTGSDRDSDRSVHVIGETSVTTKFVYICAKLESVSQLLRGRTRVHHTPSQRTAPLPSVNTRVFLTLTPVHEALCACEGAGRQAAKSPRDYKFIQKIRIIQPQFST